MYNFPQKEAYKFWIQFYQITTNFKYLGIK